jgi:diaminohydroxyphosphoribosylaminopyrimidine deaminase/5-amino-6-(5-phosphoribosylamino)uracil reductase
VVLATRLDLAPEARLFADIARSPLILFSAERSAPARHAIFEAMGARIEQAPLRDGLLDLGVVLARLRALGFATVLAEGGGRLAASLIAADAVDRLEWFRAPILLGAAGRPGIADLAYEALAQAPKWRRVALRELGPDLWESYERA